MPKLRKPQTHCRHGHEYSVVGRTKWNRCVACYKAGYTRAYTKVTHNRKFKRFCPYGHDTYETGRAPGGMCKICRQIIGREQHLKRYGITLEAYDEMFLKQDGKCLICEQIPKKLVVDHDHETGKVRGLLCDKCNMGIGQMDDSPERLRRAALYIEVHCRTSSSITL